MSVFMSVRYDDANQDSYEAIEVQNGINGPVMLFDSGNPTEDHRNAIRAALPLMAQGFDVLYTSSMDHFVMDGNRWEYSDDPILGEEGIVAQTLTYVAPPQGTPPGRWEAMQPASKPWEWVIA